VEGWQQIACVTSFVTLVGFGLWLTSRQEGQEELSDHPGAGWKQVGYCGAGYYTDRFHLAALSTDGRYCLVGGTDGETFFVWDINQNRAIWADDDIEDETDEELDNFMDRTAQFLEGSYSPIAGLKFRPIGLLQDNPLGIHPELGLEIHAGGESLSLHDVRTKRSVQSLSFKNISGDWEYASFSDDGSTIVVLTPYDITFFRRMSEA
jgi:WD40 repeat protein